MDDGVPLSIAALLLLIIAAGYFALIETAISRASRVKLRALADRGDSRAERAISILGSFDKAITTILVCSNITHIAAASVATVFAVRRWGISVTAAATVVVTVIMFLLGEMLPKSVGKKYSERIAVATSASLCFFMRVLTPVTFALTAIGAAAARLTKGDSEVTVTEEELLDIIESIKDEGELETGRAELVRSALRFDDVLAEAVLTARVDLHAIDLKAPLGETVSVIRATNHSRLPVYEGSIDNIVGVLQTRRFIKAYLETGESVNIRELLDMALFVHGSTKIDELLRELSRKKLNMAIVTDNYGGTLGVCTVEDILEELVGDIWDEDDEVVESIQKLPDGTFEADAELSVEEAFERIGFDDPEDTEWEHKALGEWAYEQFDLIPRQGDSFSYHGLTVAVSRMRGKRILSLRLAAAEGGARS